MICSLTMDIWILNFEPRIWTRVFIGDGTRWYENSSLTIIEGPERTDCQVVSCEPWCLCECMASILCQHISARWAVVRVFHWSTIQTLRNYTIPFSSWTEKSNILAFKKYLIFKMAKAVETHLCGIVFFIDNASDHSSAVMILTVFGQDSRSQYHKNE